MRRAFQRPFVSLFIALIGCVSAGVFAAEKKTWETVEQVSYVEDESNDADSFHVKAGENVFAVRLYYIDAPEINRSDAARLREQTAHFGISPEETLEAGEKAHDYVKDLLSSPFKIYTRWAAAGGRGKFPRYLALVEVDGQDLGEVLIKAGLARSKGTVVGLPSGEKATSTSTRLDTLEAEAKAQGMGVWGLAKTLAPSP